MTTNNAVTNWMGHEPGKKGSLEDIYEIEMRARAEDLVVYMNSEDLKAGRVAVGGLEIGMFAGVTNSTVQEWESKGVSFVGIPFMLPGTFLILPRQALSVIVYFDETYQESFKYHLVDNHIKHLMAKVVAFKNFPAHFGCMKVFQPDPVWLSVR